MKLINTTIRPLIWYALFVFALSVPAFFLLLNSVWASELDEYHEAMKGRIVTELNEMKLDTAELHRFLQLWSRTEQGITIVPETRRLKNDSFYTKTAFDKYYGETEKFRGMQTTIVLGQHPYRLSIVTNMEETDETYYMVAALSLLFFLLMLAGFIWIARNYSAKIWLPFYDTLARLRRFDLKTNQGIDLSPTSIDEFKELNTSITELTRNSLQTYQSQKEFTENASHELQTPVAILRSKIDLLLQDDTFTKEQTEAISQLIQPLSRLSHINRNLLLVVKIEHYQFGDEEQVSLKQLISAISAQIRDYTASDIVLSIEQDLTLQANRFLAETMLNNLVGNAIRHGGNHTIHINLVQGELTVSNAGDKSLTSEKLFKRYSHASPDSPGAGLGLAIVGEICQKYGWKPSYEFKDGKHFFRIKF
jgi:two-component system sensor histidine kinase QseC